MVYPPLLRDELHQYRSNPDEPSDTFSEWDMRNSNLQLQMVSKQKKQKKTKQKKNKKNKKSPSYNKKHTKKEKKTRLAQLVERTPFKRVVVGSSPTSGDSDETTLKVSTVLVAQLVRASVL